MNFKVNDIVKITDTGGMYTTFKDFAERHNLDKFESGFGFERESTTIENILKSKHNYGIVVVCENTKSDYELIEPGSELIGVYIPILKRHIIINSDCLKKTETIDIFNNELFEI